MKIDLTTKLTTLKGEPIKTDNGEIVTLTDVLTNSLLVDKPSTQVKEMLKKFSLATKISNAKDVVEITAEEATMIKELLPIAYKTLVVGQVWSLLDGQ